MTRQYDAQIDLYGLLRELWSRRLWVLVLLGLALASTYFAVSRMPRVYGSLATLLVEPRANFYLSPAERTADVTGAQVASQVELTRSRDTLMQVVVAEGLADLAEFNDGKTEQAALDVAVARLAGQVVVSTDRRTAIVYIRAHSSNAELAQRLANGVANAAVERRAAFLVADAARAARWLEEVIPDLRARVSAAEAAVASFRIADDRMGTTPAGSLVGEQMADLTARIAAAGERRLGLVSRAQVLDDLLRSGASVSEVADLAEAPAVDGLLRQRSGIAVQLARQSSTQLGEHPELAALRARLADLDRRIALEGRRVVEDLQAKATAEAALAAALREDLAILWETSSRNLRHDVSLDALEREAAASRALLENYLARYEAAQSHIAANAGLPDVRVVTHAMASASPAYPKASLVVAAAAIAVAAVILAWVIIAGLIAVRGASAPMARR